MCTIIHRRVDTLRAMRHTIKKRWYEKAKERMKATGISYVDLSSRLEREGISAGKSTVGAWMIGRNEPPVAVILKIGEILNMGVAELMGEDAYYVRDPIVRTIVERLDAMTDTERQAILKFLSSGITAPPSSKK